MAGLRLDSVPLFVLAAALLGAGCTGLVSEPGGKGEAQGSGGTPSQWPTGSLDCSKPQAGVARMRRLTRLEYNNTVRDLLGVTGEPATGFVPEEEVNGFNNNAEALVVGELLAEQFMDAAREIADGVPLAPLVPCAVVSGNKACAIAFIRDFGERAYRRPITPEDEARLGKVFDWGQGQAGFSLGIRMVLQVMLQSPHFLYRVELGVPAGSGDLVALTDYELATRLSYFLWSAPPDGELLAAARQGALGNRDAIRDQAVRMLESPKAESTVLDFHGQLLDLDALETVQKDPQVFPGFNNAVRSSMQAETDNFIRYVFQNDSRLETLLAGDFTFVDETLAGYYDLPGIFGPTPAKVELAAGGPRAGLLTQGSLLSVYGKFTMTDPVLRGKFVRERLLCQTPPPPPDIMFEPPQIDPDLTVREQLAQHRTDPACASCHELMDPIGLGFERFDGAGKYRETENGDPVDASGELLETDDIDGKFVGVRQLAERLAQSDQVRDCISLQWFRYAYGRDGEAEDACALAQLSTSFRRTGDLRALLIEITQTDAFYYARKAQ